MGQQILQEGETQDSRSDVVNLIVRHGAKRIAEVGAWRGALSRMIIGTKPEKFYIIDPHNTEFNEIGDYICTMGDGKKHTQEELDKIADDLLGLPATYYRMTSVQAAEMIEDGSLDFVFIDAIHDYEHVREDILTWVPKIRKGGMISGDDYRIGSKYMKARFPGVKKAVDELLPNRKLIGRIWYDTI